MRLEHCIVVCALAADLGVARGEPPPARAAYVAAAIDAIRATDAATLANTRKYLQVMARNKCQAEDMTLRVGCMLEAAAQHCKAMPGAAGERCRLASDVIATNQLAERAFVPNDVRMEIMSKQRDARKGIARELQRRYAALVAELAMSRDFPGPRAESAALGVAIDRFCTDVAGTRDLSWQYCVSATAWFIATDGMTEDAAR